jgi:Domain of unknown function (DUF1937)
MIYIASPFSSPNKITEAERFTNVSRYAQKLLATGHVSFSPVVYGYHFHTTYGVPGDFATWIEFNKAMIRASSLLDVYMLTGWKQSVGVTAEIEYATQLRIPVRYTEPL